VRRAAASLFLLELLSLWSGAALAHKTPGVRWEPESPQQGDPVVIFVGGLTGASAPVGSLGGRALSFFPSGNGYAALTGIDVEVKPGKLPWRIRVVDARGRPGVLSGALSVRERKFPVQRLTLPKEMVDLDPPTLKRVEEESKRLRAVYEGLTPERLWLGRFIRPVETAEPGEGFGARRIINGQPRAPHTGVDYSADAGTPVVAANSGRVALVADYFFPGRLVILDHGLGLYTLYFHLARVDVEEGGRVGRGQPIGAVGATGRATGPHLHFGAHLSQARIDPALLLSLPLPE
jgi:murein DD-endopeptidase MepM/ murein hydrolase activator NlpD